MHLNSHSIVLQQKERTGKKLLLPLGNLINIRIKVQALEARNVDSEWVQCALNQYNYNMCNVLENPLFIQNERKWFNRSTVTAITHFPP